MSTNVALGIKQDGGEVFVLHYKNSQVIAAVVTNERQAYSLAEMIDALVTHVPAYSTRKMAMTNSNITYEIERIMNERRKQFPQRRA